MSTPVDQNAIKQAADDALRAHNRRTSRRALIKLGILAAVVFGLMFAANRMYTAQREQDERLEQARREVRAQANQQMAAHRRGE